jgi:hypothetical protein
MTSVSRHNRHQMRVVHDHANCKRQGHDPFAYLRDVLARLPNATSDDLTPFLPRRWTPRTLKRTSCQAATHRSSGRIRSTGREKWRGPMNLVGWKSGVFRPNQPAAPDGSDYRIPDVQTLAGSDGNSVRTRPKLR